MVKGEGRRGIQKRIIERNLRPCVKARSVMSEELMCELIHFNLTSEQFETLFPILFLRAAPPRGPIWPVDRIAIYRDISIS